ncbi:amidohydrolase family protein [Paraburkholderia oxyphila]|uniref:amidohydrolase family protein n=1 Tax=Paraburkholderia oxyphila TaxID=614212 RepID=UPI00047FA27B|nr:amidohydrolase family protein [Paraburkholderia oxyphila]
MQIVDAQVHAWVSGDSTGHHRRAPITRDVLVDEMVRAGVNRVLLVPPLWDPEGNAYSLALAQAEPERFAVMGLLPAGVEDPAAAIETWREQPGMLAVRFLFNTPERLAPLLEGRYERVWPVAQESGLVVALHVPGALEEADAIARRFPRLRLIVDHLGVPRGASGPAAFDHLPALLALARHPNVHVKAAGVGDYALDPWPFRSIEPPLRQIFDAFGAQRVVWGSDLSRLHHPYRQCVTHFSETLAWLSDADRAAVMGGNLCRLLGWNQGGSEERGRAA